MKDSELRAPFVASVNEAERVAVTVALGELAPWEGWRFGTGQGFVSPVPVDVPVSAMLAATSPRYVRVALQEYFHVNPSRGEFRWDALDAYLHRITASGAQLIASFNLKPPWLFPVVDHDVWQPSDRDGWLTLITEVVHRYSVQLPWVSHWEVAQEPDIGELGGTPFRIPDPVDYHDFYRDFADVVARTAPRAKVGGPGVAYGPAAEPLPGFVELCRTRGTRLDFISWHLYKNQPERHVAAVEQAAALIRGMDPRPELVITEWNRNFTEVNVADQGADSHYSAWLLRCTHALMGTEVDLAFIYHLQDIPCDPEDYATSMSPAGREYLRDAWSRSPWRLGLVDESGRATPRWYAFAWFAALRGHRATLTTSSEEVLGWATVAADGTVRLLLVNGGASTASDDVVVELAIDGLRRTRSTLRHERLHGHGAGPVVVDRRSAYHGDVWGTQVLLPADSVTSLTLEPLR